MQRPLVLTLLALAAGTAQAAGPTPAGWSLLGDTLNASGVLTLTTAYTDEAPFNVSGAPAAFIDAVEPAAGVAAYALDGADEPAYEGSVASQSFVVQAGDTLSFDWAFTTQETLFQDHAFVVLDGQLITLATRSTAPAGVQGFSHTFSGAGTATLAFGVVDTGDFLGVSQLVVSDVQLAAVPEPATWALWLAGAGLLGAGRRRARP
ncbi:MAG: PEP-CTERM sorting domain-containing protein [Rubrivivax sp.]|nr:PEP-CTERM sorting domain-containing protein [Rubrivivax sp.]